MTTCLFFVPVPAPALGSLCINALCVHRKSVRLGEFVGFGPSAFARAAEWGRHPYLGSQPRLLSVGTGRWTEIAYPGTDGEGSGRGGFILGSDSLVSQLPDCRSRQQREKDVLI